MNQQAEIAQHYQPELTNAGLDSTNAVIALNEFGEEIWSKTITGGQFDYSYFLGNLSSKLFDGFSGGVNNWNLIFLENFLGLLQFFKTGIPFGVVAIGISFLSEVMKDLCGRRQANHLSSIADNGVGKTIVI